MKGDSASQAEQRVVSICGIGPVDSNPGAGAVQDAEQQLPRIKIYDGTSGCYAHQLIFLVSHLRRESLTAQLLDVLCMRQVRQLLSVAAIEGTLIGHRFPDRKKAKGQREFDHPRWFFADKTRIFMIFQYLPISAFSRDLSSRITVLQGTQTMAVSFGSTIDFVDAGWPHSKWSFRPILALLLGRAKPRIYAWWISWGQT